jgi:hypothetical protein
MISQTGVAVPINMIPGQQFVIPTHAAGDVMVMNNNVLYGGPVASATIVKPPPDHYVKAQHIENPPVYSTGATPGQLYLYLKYNEFVT